MRIACPPLPLRSGSNSLLKNAALNKGIYTHNHERRQEVAPQPQPLHLPPPSLPMDGLDAMMADLAAKPAAKPVRRQSKPSPRESAAVGAPATPAGAREQVFGERLRQLHLQIADPSTRAAINHGLGAVCDGWFADGSAEGKSGSRGGGGGGGGSYYAKSAALAQYTLASELGRMDYEFTLDGGEGDGEGGGGGEGAGKAAVLLTTVGDGVAAVRARLAPFAADPEAATAGTFGALLRTAAGRAHLLLRLANQSLLADFLSQLQVRPLAVYLSFFYLLTYLLTY